MIRPIIRQTTRHAIRPAINSGVGGLTLPRTGLLLHARTYDPALALMIDRVGANTRTVQPLAYGVFATNTEVVTLPDITISGDFEITFKTIIDSLSELRRWFVGASLTTLQIRVGTTGYLDAVLGEGNSGIAFYTLAPLVVGNTYNMGIKRVGTQWTFTQNGATETKTGHTDGAVLKSIGRSSGGFVGKIWDININGQAIYPHPTQTGATAATWFDTSGNGLNGVATVADVETHCGSGMVFGSDHLNQKGFINSDGSGNYPENTIIPLFTDAPHRTAKTVREGATAGYTLALDQEADPDFTYLPPDIITYLGGGKWYLTDNTKRSSFIGFPFPVVAGRYYEISSKYEYPENRGTAIFLRAGMHFSNPVIASDLSDYEETRPTSGIGTLKRLHKATATGTLFSRVVVGEVGGSSIYQLTISEVVIREYIPQEKSDSLKDNTIAFWGDSITAGAYPYYTRKYAENLLSIYNGGVGSETSAQIKTRMLAATQYHGNRTVICAGTNDFAATPTNVMPNVRDMVAALTHDNYIVCSPLGNSATTQTGTQFRTNLNLVKAELAAEFGDRYIDIEQFVIDAYDPDIAQDVIDYGNGVTPSSLRGDTLHPNYAGHELIAAKLAEYYPEFFVFDPVTPATYPGRAKYNVVPVGAKCATLATGTSIAITGVTGATILSKEGAGTVTVGTNVITRATDGTLYNLKLTLSTGRILTLPFSEGEGVTTRGYDNLGNIFTGTITAADINAFWAGTQDTFFHGLEHGCNIVTGVTIPANPITGLDVLGNPLAYPPGRYNPSASYKLQGPELFEALGESDYYDVNGVSLAFTYSDLLTYLGNQVFFGVTKKELAVYSGVQIDPALSKIKKALRIS